MFDSVIMPWNSPLDRLATSPEVGLPWHRRRLNRLTALKSIIRRGVHQMLATLIAIELESARERNDNKNSSAVGHPYESLSLNGLFVLAAVKSKGPLEVVLE